jgi:eukaryotic-like serine/threonine-protein kinase
MPNPLGLGRVFNGVAKRGRMTISVSTAAILVLGLSAAALPKSGVAQEAAMFRADAEHRGLYASQAPTLGSVQWRFQTKAKIISSPAVADGVVYIGSGDGNVYAVRAADGVLAWKFATRGPVNSSPAVWAGSVFVSSLDGNVYALGAASGRLKWRFKTAGERRFTAPGIHGLIPRTESMPDPYDVFLSSPAVVDGTVYIGSGDHNVYALDAETGALRWKFRTGNVVHASPAVSRGVVYIGSWDRYFYALDARSGTVHWKFATGDDRDIYNQVGIAGSAAVADGTVYFGCRDSFFYALDAQTGQLRWKHDDHGSWVIASPGIAGGSVYFTTSDERKFFGLEAATGRPRFSVGYGAFSFSSPALAGDAAYYGTFDGRLYEVDVRTGKVVGQFETDGSSHNLPKYLNAKGELDLDAVYPDATLEGAYVGLNRIYTFGSIVGSPAIAGGVLFVGSTDGTLYALQ